jgi:2-polyprenyl-3-methyl-5-hydroxy-6-metoxy-1,4-benzoquinol methylase
MNQHTASYVKCDLCGSESGVRIIEKEGMFYERCSQCGFIYTNPRSADFTSDNTDAFEGHLDKYIARSYTPKIQKLYRRTLQRFASYRSTNRILEIGSNIGGFLFQARQQGWDPIGIEPVAQCAEYGRRHHGLNIISTTLERADLPSNAFDVVYSISVFEHIASPSRILQEVCRILRPGGVIYIDTVNYDSYTQRFVGAADWDTLSPRVHLSLFTPTTLPKFCEQAGLVVKRVSTHGIRLRSSKGGKLRGVDRLREMALKFPLSVACRFTLKGDSIAILAQKPERRS